MTVLVNLATPSPNKENAWPKHPQDIHPDLLHLFSVKKSPLKQATPSPLKAFSAPPPPQQQPDSPCGSHSARRPSEASLASASFDSSTAREATATPPSAFGEPSSTERERSDAQTESREPEPPAGTIPDETASQPDWLVEDNQTDWSGVSPESAELARQRTQTSPNHAQRPNSSILVHHDDSNTTAPNAHLQEATETRGSNPMQEEEGEALSQPGPSASDHQQQQQDVHLHSPNKTRHVSSRRKRTLPVASSRLPKAPPSQLAATTNQQDPCTSLSTTVSSAASASASASAGSTRSARPVPLKKWAKPTAPRQQTLAPAAVDPAPAAAAAAATADPADAQAPADSESDLQGARGSSSPESSEEEAPKRPKKVSLNTVQQVREISWFFSLGHQSAWLKRGWIDGTASVCAGSL